AVPVDITGYANLIAIVRVKFVLQLGHRIAAAVAREESQTHGVRYRNDAQHEDFVGAGAIRITKEDVQRRRTEWLGIVIDNDVVWFVAADGQHRIMMRGRE